MNIPCAVHDYFEAVVVCRADLVLQLRDGEELRGRASNLARRDNQECLLLMTVCGDVWVPLEDIAVLEIPAERRRLVL